MKIKVNADSCIACGACEAISEELFEVGEACKEKRLYKSFFLSFYISQYFSSFLIV